MCGPVLWKMQKTYYEILGCEPSESIENIRKAYQKLVLQHHPDKQSGDTKNDEFYVQIDKAWKTLRDENTRKIYDAELYQQKLNQQLNIFAEVQIEDLTADSDVQVLSYPCRCGSSYTVERKDLEDELWIECDECSLVIVVKKKS